MAVHTLNPNRHRLQILSADEIEALYSRPRFSEEEREEYFSLTASEQELLQQLRTVKSKTYFILQLGYFKAKRQFFSFELNEVEGDLNTILAQHFADHLTPDFSAIDKATRIKQQRLIRQRFGYRRCDAAARRQLAGKAKREVQISAKPVYLFRQLANHLGDHKIVLPSYSTMQDIIGQAISEEQKRLTAIVRQHLKPFDLQALEQLLADTEGLYEITQLKREPRDFSYREIKREIQRGEQLQHFYWLAKALLPVLNISNEGIKYYASLVSYYSVYQLKQLNPWMVYLYLLCFSFYRYQRSQDILIKCLFYQVRRCDDEAKAQAKERLYELSKENRQNLRKAGRVLKLFTDDSIAQDTRFETVQKQAFHILEREKLAWVADQLASRSSFDETEFHWQALEPLSQQFKLHLRPIVQNLELTALSPHQPLLDAVRFLKSAFARGKSLSQYPTHALPVGFIKPSAHDYFYREGATGKQQIIPDRYEFLVYRLLYKGLDAGEIACKDSVGFRSFDDDLVSPERWQNKAQVLSDVGLSLLQKPIQAQLAEFEQLLETRIREVNQRIESGDNPHF